MSTQDESAAARLREAGAIIVGTNSMMGSGARLAIARAAATIVAVAPTLEAKSQVSLSNRVLPMCVMQYLSTEFATDLIFSQGKELSKLYALCLGKYCVQPDPFAGERHHRC